MPSDDMTMTGKRKITVEDAYRVETPADNIRLYEQWADSYDEDFVDSQGYVYHLRIADHLLRRHGAPPGPVLDVGCGTGVVGAALRNAGVAVVDGVDISTRMLAQCRQKRCGDGEPVYRRLIEADLTRRLEIADGTYAALVSAGTFTHGHLGPDALGRLWRLAGPGAPCVIGVNRAHFETQHFADRLEADARAGTITMPDLIAVDIYSADRADPEHAGDQALIIDCRVL